MGTRALIHIKDSTLKSQTLVTIYRQYDGYPEGLGAELKAFLKDAIAVNGIMVGDKRKIFNGMGCFAASLISYLKKEVGNVYIYPTNSIDVGEEYTYTLYLDRGCFDSNQEIKLRIESN